MRDFLGRLLIVDLTSREVEVADSPEESWPESSWTAGEGVRGSFRNWGWSSLRLWQLPLDILASVLYNVS